MTSLNKIFDTLSFLFFDIKYKTGFIVFYLFMENLYICIWSISIFLFILIFISINIDYLYNFDFIFLSTLLQSSYIIFKYLLIINIFLLLIHLYVSIKHILLDYIRDIDSILMYLFLIFISYLTLVVITIYFYQLNLNNISFILQNIITLCFILFIFFINFLLINKSMHLIISKQRNGFIPDVNNKNYFSIFYITIFSFIIFYVVAICWRLNFLYINIFNMNIPYFIDWFFEIEAISVAVNATSWSNELTSNLFYAYWQPFVYNPIKDMIGGWANFSYYAYTKYYYFLFYEYFADMILSFYQKFNLLNISYTFKPILSNNIQINKLDLNNEVLTCTNPTDTFTIFNPDYTWILELISS